MKTLKQITLLIFCFTLTPFLSNAQWTQTSGPIGAAVNSIVIKGSYIVAGTDNGVYRKLIESSEWQSGNTTLFGNRIQDLKTDTYYIYAATNNGIYKSSDEGFYWDQSGLSDQIVTDLMVKDTLVYAGTVGGLFVSDDKGQSWNNISNGLGNAYIIALASNIDLILASVFNDGLYKSYDSGNSWIKTEFPENFVTAVTCYGEEILAASFDDIVYRSTDYGNTWSSSEIGNNNQVRVTHFTINGPVIYATTNSGVYKSTSSGYVWDLLGLSNTYTKRIITNNSTLIAGTIQGVFESGDSGVTWTEINNGLLSADVTSLDVSGNKLFAGTNGFGVSLSTDYGESWSVYNNGLSNKFVTGLGTNGDILLAGTHAGLFLTSSSTDSWQKVSVKTGSRNFIFSENDIIASSDYGVLRSSDSGNTWVMIDSVYEGGIYQVWAVLIIDQTIIAGYNQKGIRISTDNGSNWHYSNTGLPNYPTINSLEIVEGKILAGTSGGGIFLSADTGRSWFPSELDTTQIWTLFATDQFVLGGGGRGICQSNDGGFSWRWVNQGLDNYFVYSLNSCGGYIFAGVTGGAVWRRPVSQLVSVQNIQKPHQDFFLSQNYPNPFNLTTNIEFQIPYRELVTIKVYDILGNEVAILLNEEKTAGTYIIKFGGSNLSSGVYFYQLKTREYAATRKFILIK